MRSHLEDPTSQQRGQSSYSEAGGAIDECCGGGVAQSVWGTTLVPNSSAQNSQSPLEMKTSFRGARLGILGLIRSSTVTAAMALILVDAVLCMEEKQALGHSAGCLGTNQTHRTELVQSPCLGPSP